jgi:hypothetical protein
VLKIYVFSAHYIFLALILVSFFLCFLKVRRCCNFDKINIIQKILPIIDMFDLNSQDINERNTFHPLIFLSPFHILHYWYTQLFSGPLVYAVEMLI